MQTSTATASTAPAHCESAAAAAARKTGVPLDILRAIMLAESGRHVGGQFRAWPWAINLAGRGYWFDSEGAARAFAQRQSQQGTRNFDVGCFQLNFRWHGSAFRSLGEMLDPVPNALYAARFLQELFRETGSWPAAVGAYHSRTPALANTYLRRFSRIHAALSMAAPFPAPAAAPSPQPRPTGPIALLGSGWGPPPLPGSLFPGSAPADRKPLLPDTRRAKWF